MNLGIDSIKRVEILAALETVVPALAGTEAARMASLRTLGDFRDHLRSVSGLTGRPAPPEVATHVNGKEGNVSADASRSFPRQIVQVTPAPALGFALAGLRAALPLIILVSEKTGQSHEEAIAGTLAAGLRKYGLTVEVSVAMPAETRGVIFLGGLRSLGRIEDAVEVQRSAFRAARQFARSADNGGVFVTRL